MKKLYASPLFQGLTPTEIDLLLVNRHRILQFKAGEPILMQGSAYKALLIVADGSVKGEMTTPAGERIIMEQIHSPRSIAPAFLYATDNTLPVDVIALSDTTLISIPIKHFTEILQQEVRVLVNFIRSMSDRSKFLSNRIRLLGFGTIKSKLANYLLQRMQQEGNPDFYIPHTHQELADLFGVTRPALSRAWGQLVEEGILTTHKKHITITNQSQLIRLVREN